MFNKKSIVGSMAAAAMVFSSSAFAMPVTQSTAPANSDSYWYGNGWNFQTLGSVTLPTGTNSILALTSTVTLVDQGWGGQDNNNGVKISLFDNSTAVWTASVAGATHAWTTQTFDINAVPGALNQLNTALAGVNWANNIQLTMYTTPYAWLGWELHVRDASFSVTSVPEPTSVALLGLGLVGVAAARRRKAN